MRIGILGGSFNPVHKDHYLLASYIKDVLSLDKFLIIPNAMPPHKNTCHISFEDRVKMLSLTSFDRDGFEISDIENDPSIPHYSYDTNLVVTGREGYSYDDINHDVIPFIQNYGLLGKDKLGLCENELLKLQNHDFINKHYCIILKRCFHNVSSSKIRIEFQNFYQKYANFAKKSVFFEHINDYPCCKQFLDKAVIEYILDNGIYRQL